MQRRDEGHMVRKRRTGNSRKRMTPKRTSKYESLIQEFDDAVKRHLIKSYELPHLDKKSCGRFVVYKPIIDGIRFDSALEAEYYLYLLEHHIQFKRQVRFELQPSYKLESQKRRTPKIEYVADFVLYDNDMMTHVIDVKGRETPEFKIKKKLFEFKYQVPLECIAKYQGEWMTLSEIKKLKKETA